MTSFLVETEDLAQVATSVHGGGATLESALERLASALAGCGGMAGDDPAGTQWATDYDTAARTTLRATRSATNSVYHLAAMFAQTARNYEAAEQASTPAPGRPAIDPMLLPDTVVSWGNDAPPPACGAGTSGPTGWSVVMHFVHAVWPNGHQDRLHTAAAAWQASASALDRVGDEVLRAPAPLEGDRLPEEADVHTVCRTVADRLSELAYAHRTLAHACTELAGHIDDAHASIEHELVSLLEWSAAIQVIGGLLSVVTLGGAEAPTQAEQVARIAATAAKITALIERFAALARAAAEALPSLTGWSESLARAMDEFVNGRLAVAEVTAVRTLPPAVSVEGISATEMAAEERLASEAATTLDLEAVPGAIREDVLRTIERARVGKIANAGHDGKRFKNLDGDLPASLHYQEWTVSGATAKRGAYRIIIDGEAASPKAIYFWDHINPPVRIGP